jgi:hypothetical protein
MKYVPPPPPFRSMFPDYRFITALAALVFAVNPVLHPGLLEMCGWPQGSTSQSGKSDGKLLDSSGEADVLFHMTFLTCATWFGHKAIPCLFKGRLNMYNCRCQTHSCTFKIKFCCLKVSYHHLIQGQRTTIYKNDSILLRNVRALCDVIISVWSSHWDHASMNNDRTLKGVVGKRESRISYTYQWSSSASATLTEHI